MRTTSRALGFQDGHVARSVTRGHTAFGDDVRCAETRAVWRPGAGVALEGAGALALTGARGALGEPRAVEHAARGDGSHAGARERHEHRASIARGPRALDVAEG